MYGYSDLRQHPTPERTNSNVTWARHHEVPALLLGLKRHRHFVVAIVTFNFCKVYFIFSMLVVHTVYFVFSIVAQNLSQIIHMHYPTTFTISSRKRLQLRACINMFTMCWLMYRYNVCTYIYIYTRTHVYHYLSPMDESWHPYTCRKWSLGTHWYITTKSAPRVLMVCGGSSHLVRRLQLCWTLVGSGTKNFTGHSLPTKSLSGMRHHPKSCSHINNLGIPIS